MPRPVNYITRITSVAMDMHSCDKHHSYAKKDPMSNSCQHHTLVPILRKTGCLNAKCCTHRCMRSICVRQIQGDVPAARACQLAQSFCALKQTEAALEAAIQLSATKVQETRLKSHTAMINALG
eukprot:2520655-Amphidinium_carterae.1